MGPGNHFGGPPNLESEPVVEEGGTLGWERIATEGAPPGDRPTLQVKPSHFGGTADPVAKADCRGTLEGRSAL
jgi:hypothetical protein